MKREEIKHFADLYEEQAKLEKLYRDNLNAQIEGLEKQISESHNKNIYKVIYKGLNANYGEFVEEVARELRSRSLATLTVR